MRTMAAESITGTAHEQLQVLPRIYVKAPISGVLALSWCLHRPQQHVLTALHGPGAHGSGTAATCR